MSLKTTFLAGAALIAASAVPALAQEAPGKGVSIYMQMGGNPGDGATLARQTGATAAAKALGVDRLNEQFSAWAPEKMIEQFKQAMAAKPSCIVIMGHPGSDAFRDLVKQATDQGIVVTHGNAPLSDLQKAHGPQGFGYSGVDLYEGGKLTAQEMIKAGNLKSGDKAMVYGVFSQAERGQSEKGLAETLEKAGLKVDRLEITQEANSDASLAVPVLAAYVQRNPDLKAIGTQHGGITSVLGDVLKRAGKKPGEITVGGIDLAPCDDRRPQIRLRLRHAGSAPLSAGLHPGHAMRAVGKIQNARDQREYRRRRHHAEIDRRAGAADRGGHPLRMHAPFRDIGPLERAGKRAAGLPARLPADPRCRSERIAAANEPLVKNCEYRYEVSSIGGHVVARRHTLRACHRALMKRRKKTRDSVRWR